jgi:hypothetical protein
MFSAEEMGHDELQLNPDGRGFFNASATDPRLSQYYPHLLPLQFTGLLDKYGKEIYEGDIIKRVHRPEYIEWNNEEAAFFIRDKVWQGDLLGIFITDKLEVIGNIYSNPELLKP